MWKYFGFYWCNIKFTEFRPKLLPPLSLRVHCIFVHPAVFFLLCGRANFNFHAFFSRFLFSSNFFEYSNICHGVVINNFAFQRLLHFCFNINTKDNISVVVCGSWSKFVSLTSYEKITRKKFKILLSRVLSVHLLYSLNI